MPRSSDLLLEIERHIDDTSAGIGYDFIDIDVPDALRSVPVPRLIGRLGMIKTQVQGPIPSADYPELRRAYIAINMALNEMAIIAPRFRPSLSAGGPLGSKRTAIDNMISNDHQVLDLHWLAEALFKSEPDSAREERWQGLFGYGRCFDFGMAASFAGTTGSASRKCGILGIPDDEQLQLRTIQEDAVRSFWKRQREHRERVRGATAAAARDNPHLRGKAVKYGNVAVAIACAEYVGYAAEDWYEMMTGEKIPASTVSDIRRRLPTLIAGKAAPRKRRRRPR